MTGFVYALMLAGFLVFLVACIVRAVSYGRLPVHLRWELYPVPHEERERVEHGGSYFEAVDWWNKPGRFNLAGEMKFMIPEMLFLKGLWEFNRRMWYRSFPFHFGLYLMVGALALAALAALVWVVSPPAFEGAAGALLRPAYKVLGVVGALLSIFGAAGLLHMRLTERRFKNYTAPGDLFNLVFFIVTLAALLGGFALRDADAPGLVAILRGLARFDTNVPIGGLLAAGLILGSLLVAYIPLTHMSHFIAKYFTYHSVRWDDVPAVRARELQKKLAQYLTYRPTWSAEHMRANGQKTWAEVAQENPNEEAKK